jgi:hypothetical protein
MIWKPEARTDKGATAITIAIAMLLLMGFSALAIDGGNALGDRRVLASGADTGALGAIQFARPSLIDASSVCFGIGGGLDNEAACRGAEEAIEVIDGTLPGRFSPADWLACADPNRPIEFAANLSPLSRCISFTENFSKSRVKTPDTDLDTTFGALMGFDSIRTGANAEAQILHSATATVQPWAIGPTGAGNDQVCLMANSASNLDIPPCNGPASGNFGKLDLALYGNSLLGTPRICGNAMPQIKMATNIVVGTDHFLEEQWQIPGTIVNDFASCPILSERIDEVRTQTGNSENGIYRGYFTGIATPAREGRLMCKGALSGSTGGEDPAAGLSSSSCVNVHNPFPETLDNTPLWTFISPGASAESGGACNFGISDRQAMEACLAAWNAYGAHGTYLFEKTLATAPRYGAVPILNNDPSLGSGDYLIEEFRPIYVSTIYLKCNGPQTCDVVHSPLEAGPPACPNPLTPIVNTCGLPGNGNKNIVAVTSYMLTLDMLHPELAEFFPATQGTVLFNLSK